MLFNILAQALGSGGLLNNWVERNTWDKFGQRNHVSRQFVCDSMLHGEHNGVGLVMIYNVPSDICQEGYRSIYCYGVPWDMTNWHAIDRHWGRWLNAELQAFPLTLTRVVNIFPMETTGISKAVNWIRMIKRLIYPVQQYLCQTISRHCHKCGTTVISIPRAIIITLVGLVIVRLL